LRVGDPPRGVGYSNGRVCQRLYSPVAVAALAAVSLAGCRNIPAPYAPPEQRPRFDDPAHWQRIVHMDDVDAPDHFVRDIAAHLDGTWRWGTKRPAVRIHALAAENLKYAVELAVPEATFRSTGPVTIAFLVNEKVLDRVRYETAGTHKFEKPVPSGWLRPEEDVVLGAEIDKIYMEGPTPRGFIIVSMGLVNAANPPEQH
jgi:hypothetical protein